MTDGESGGRRFLFQTIHDLALMVDRERAGTVIRSTTSRKLTIPHDRLAYKDLNRA